MLKKIISPILISAHLLLTLQPCLGHTDLEQAENACARPAVPAVALCEGWEKTEDNKHSAYTDAITTALQLGCIATLFWLTTPQETRDAITQQLQPSALVFNLIQEYATWSFTTASHEAGHALAQYYITGEMARIHLGSTTHGQEPLYRIGNIDIDGFSPMHGHTEALFQKKTLKQITDILKQSSQQGPLEPCALALTGDGMHSITDEQRRKLMQSPEFEALKQALLPERSKYAAFLLAGGIAGLIAYHSAQLAITKNINVTSITFNQLFNALIPFHKQSDGTVLWKECIHVPESIINALLDIAPLIEIMAELYCVHVNPHSTSNAPVHSKCLIGLMNYLMRGYLRLHA